MHSRSALLALLLLAGRSTGHAAEYQWSVPIESMVSSETKAPPRAWLWIPPGCKQVRAVLVGQHNLLEEPILENQVIRRALTDLDMAEVWVSPAFDGTFHPEKGAGVQFNAIMKALAQESGYSELEWAPVMPIGHSAMAGFPYQFAAWNPERTLVAISIKGQWPDNRNPGDFDFDNSRLNTVPILYINGEYEDANGRAAKAANFRKKYPLCPLTMVADPGAGHFDFHDRLANYMALYFREVAQYRLPAKSPLRGPVPLTPIDPTKSGWLYDRFRRDEAPKAAPAAADTYGGPKDEAFWAFDGPLAQATHDYAQQYHGLKPELLGYLQNGELQPQNPKTHQQVTLKFAAGPDGTTFKIEGTFIDSVPDGRPPGWTGLPVSSPISHSDNGVPVDIEVTTGPLHKVDAETFAIQFGKTGFDNGQRGGDIWFQATHDGDAQYKRAVQQALLRIPVRNTAGQVQSISFDAIPNQTAGIKSLPLAATSSSALPVSFFVQAGPAEIVGDHLQFSALPPRAKMPLKVTVVAYQWGRPVEPRLQSAMPITRTFYLLSPGAAAPDQAQLAQDENERRALWQTAKDQLAALAPVVPANPPAAAAPKLSVTPLSPADFGRALSFNFAKKAGMEPGDLAGDTVRFGNWNNIFGLQAGAQTDLQSATDSAGRAVPVHVSILGGATAFNSNTFDVQSDATAAHNEAKLFNGAYDQNEGTPTQITVEGIPFAHYDVVFYRFDDGVDRAGKFQIGDQTLYVRGGKSNPDANGVNYLRSRATAQGNGNDIEQGNFVHFQNLSGAQFLASFQAVNAGDRVQRCKVAGFQIVERK